MEHDVVSAIAAALQQGKFSPADPRDLDAAVRSIADDVARGSASENAAVNAMTALNEERQFEHTRTIGKAWLESRRPFDAVVTKRYAQALIDLFELEPAEELLNDALREVSQPSAGVRAKNQETEYLGLLGRIEKQRFVATQNEDRLVSATDRYLVQLSHELESPNWFWHAINAIALAEREKRLGISRSHPTTPAPSAERVYERMRTLHVKTPDDPWVPATASEACLALDRCDDAELWLYRFLNHAKVRPFYIQSYDRQLREIWEGDPAREGTGCADRLARIMARHVMRTQSQLSISTKAIPALKDALSQQTPEGLEKNFLGEGTFSLANIRDMLNACSSIGCVTNATGARLGTGFLLDGGWLGFAEAGTVFVTNAHVISATVPKAIPPASARVTFEAESEVAGMPLFYKVGEVLFSLPPAKLSCAAEDDLDVTIVTLEPATDARTTPACLRPADVLPLVQPKSRAYVVGYPLGSGLQVSLHDSLLLDIDDGQRMVHYRTPTDPGSSGSPVFNTEWELIGLHHGGSSSTPRLHGAGEYEANEAISLLSIRERIRARPR